MSISIIDNCQANILTVDTSLTRARKPPAQAVRTADRRLPRILRGGRDASKALIFRRYVNILWKHSAKASAFHRQAVSAGDRATPPSAALISGRFSFVSVAYLSDHICALFWKTAFCEAYKALS
ncbi:MAG: hypothetical protein J7515_08720, partial [Caulobacter sp.]|nr:hypothetical protein [Caulobacter sp.]